MAGLTERHVDLQTLKQKWVSLEDSGLAVKMSNDEWSDKKKWNKRTRSLERAGLLRAQTDQQHENEVFSQHHEQRRSELQRLADEDTEVAARMLEQEKRRLHKEQVERERAAHEDAQLARQLHEEERQAILKRLKDLELKAEAEADGGEFGFEPTGDSDEAIAKRLHDEEMAKLAAARRAAKTELKKNTEAAKKLKKKEEFLARQKEEMERIQREKADARLARKLSQN